jgi:hypothetical protein
MYLLEYRWIKKPMPVITRHIVALRESREALPLEAHPFPRLEVEAHVLLAAFARVFQHQEGSDGCQEGPENGGERHERYSFFSEALAKQPVD